MNNVYDAVVVGAGPAGSIFARLAPSALSLCVVDRPKGEGGFSKPCGGLISPDARRSLASLGLSVPQEVLVSPAPQEVRVISVDTGMERYYPRAYLNTDRAALDRWFRSLIPSSVPVVEGVCTAVVRENGLYAVSVRTADGEKKLLARNLIGADGGGSLIRRTFLADVKIRRYTAVQRWFRGEAPSGYACVFDPEATDCCAWSIEKDGLFLYGGAFAPSACGKTFEQHLARMQRYGYDFSRPLRTEACVVYRPAGLRQITSGRDGVFLLGEAAGLISPSSLEGISFAVDSACALASAFSGSPEGIRSGYEKNLRHLKNKIFLRLCKSPFLYAPFLRFAVLKSGITALR